MKTFNISTLLKAIIGCSFIQMAPLHAKDEISVITSSTKIWNQSTNDVKNRFAGFNWQTKKDGYQAASPNGLVFWGQDILSLSVKGSASVNSLDLHVYDSKKSPKIDQSSFLKRASVWKKLLDEKTKQPGKTLSKFIENGKQVQVVSWDLPSAMIILSAKWSMKPDELGIKIFPKAQGSQYLASLGKKKQPATKAQPKKTELSTIAQSLKGHTYFLNGKKLKKKDISGNPDYYLVYFSASW